MNIHDDPARAEETRLLLQAAIESANDAILITEYQLQYPGPRIEFVNPAFTRMTQYSAAEIVGRTPRILQGPKTDHTLVSRIPDDLKTGQSFHGQTTNYRKDGSEYEVEWRITPVHDRAGLPIKWLAVQRDVTDRIRSQLALKLSEQQLLIANKDLQQFVYAASHDLQEPVRNISLHSQFLVKYFADQLPDAANEHLSYVLNGSRRLGNLIRDLLAYSRASYTDVEPVQPVDVNQMITHVQHDLQSLLEETGTIIEAENLPLLLMPETQLQQIYSNLISNAVKYRKPGIAPQLRLGASRDRNDSSFLKLWVQDNGQGIPAQYHREVFRVFRRLTNQDQTGTGIGLAIVQRLIEKHRGSIWVESDGENGSTFFFTVPWEMVADAKANQHSAC